MLYRGRAKVVPEKFRAARLAAGMTQAALANRLGCTDAMVAQVELGRRTFGLERTVQAAGILGVAPSDIAAIDVTAEEIEALAKAVS